MRRTIITIALLFAANLSFAQGILVDDPWEHKTGFVVLTDIGDAVGIGSATPRDKLDVNGAIYGTSFFGDGSNLTGTSPWEGPEVDGMIHYEGGNVGIGTSAPNYKLEVDGDIYTTGDIIGNNYKFSYSAGVLTLYVNDIAQAQWPAE